MKLYGPRFELFCGLLFTCLVFGSPPQTRAENWPQWRGPRGDGTSLEKGIVTEWDKTKNVVWVTEIPGDGYSSPIVWEDKIFVTTALGDGHDRALVRIDAKTGKVLWTKTLITSSDLEHLNKENGYASSTSATDGKAVYSSFYASGRTHIFANDFDGNTLWHADPLISKTEHGYTYTPILAGDKLIVSVDQLADSAEIAFDTKTGKIAWRIEGNNISCSHVPPLVINSGGREQVVTCGSNVTRGVDPKTGEVIWSCAGPTNYCVAGLVFGDNKVLTSGGYPERHSFAVKTDEKGDVNAKGVLWHQKKGTTYVPSPIYDNGYFYSVTDGGVTYCYDAATGDIKWQQRIPGHFRTSLVLTEGNLHTTNDEGVTTIFKATPDRYTEVAKNNLDEFIYPSPAVSNGKLYIRTKKNLYCIGK